MLKLVRMASTGSLAIVYRCLHVHGTEVAVKGISFPPGFNSSKKEVLMQTVLQAVETWKSLTHLNIVPLLGTIQDSDFGFDYPCIVSLWMTNGTLGNYVKQRGTKFSALDRIHLIKGLVSGLEYLHSQGIIHGNLHPGNVLIDDGHNARITDFGFPLPLFPVGDPLSYLWADSIQPNKPMWAAPEVLYPQLYPNLRFEATHRSDIYLLGSLILFVLSGHYPWKDEGEAETGLKKLENPRRPAWPVNMPDSVWDFIERCWSPRDPENRPSAHEALTFCTDKLEQLLQPNPGSEINVVLFGAVGSGKSSIINLLIEMDVAQVSSDAKPCTERPRSYQASVGDHKFRLWDTVGFPLANEGTTGHVSPYQQAHALLQSLPEGVNLVLLCVDKGMITPLLGRLYWFINDFLYGGRVPIALVVTHVDMPDKEWWERNERDIARRANIPVHSMPHAHTTTTRTNADQSKDMLKALLQAYAPAFPAITLRRGLASCTQASSGLMAHCRLNKSKALTLAEELKKPLRRPFNAVFFGGTGSEVINLISGRSLADTSHPRKISTGCQQFHIWSPQLGPDAPMGMLQAAIQLVRDISNQGGVDLFVLCKRYGTLTPEELNLCKLFECLGKGKYPIVVVITGIELLVPAEKWWEMNGKHLVQAIRGKVAGHCCIPALTNYNRIGMALDKAHVESRLSIEAMLEECVSVRSIHPLKAIKEAFERRTGHPTMVIRDLATCFGLNKEQTENLIQMYDY